MPCLALPCQRNEASVLFKFRDAGLNTTSAALLIKSDPVSYRVGFFLVYRVTKCKKYFSNAETYLI